MITSHNSWNLAWFVSMLNELGICLIMSYKDANICSNPHWWGHPRLMIDPNWPLATSSNLCLSAKVLDQQLPVLRWIWSVHPLLFNGLISYLGIVRRCNCFGNGPLQLGAHTLIIMTLTHILYTPDRGLYLELCQHCACLFHDHVFIQVRGIQEVQCCIISAGHTASMLCSWTWPHSGQEAFWSVLRKHQVQFWIGIRVLMYLPFCGLCCWSNKTFPECWLTLASN